MPQNPVLVYSVESGEPAYMHTVDAREAVQLGDYTWEPPGGKEVTPEDRSRARARFQTGQAVAHAELQSPEERARLREEAQAQEDFRAAVPPGTPVVVQMPAPAPARQHDRQASRQVAAPSHPVSPPVTHASAAPPSEGPHTVTSTPASTEESRRSAGRSDPSHRG